MEIDGSPETTLWMKVVPRKYFLHVAFLVGTLPGVGAGCVLYEKLSKPRMPDIKGLWEYKLTPHGDVLTPGLTALGGTVEITINDTPYGPGIGLTNGKRTWECRDAKYKKLDPHIAWESSQSAITGENSAMIYIETNDPVKEIKAFLNLTKISENSVEGVHYFLPKNHDSNKAALTYQSNIRLMRLLDNSVENLKNTGDDACKANS